MIFEHIQVFKPGVTLPSHVLDQEKVRSDALDS